MPVVVGEMERQRMAQALEPQFIAQPESRPDMARWDWDDALIMLQRLKSHGRGGYEALQR
jgi:hypothetical protein